MPHTRGQAALLSSCALLRALALSAAFPADPQTCVCVLEAPAPAPVGFFFFFCSSSQACGPAGRRPAALAAPFPALRPVIPHLVAFDSHPSERLNEFPVVLGVSGGGSEAQVGGVSALSPPPASAHQRIIKVSFHPCGGISSLR